MIKVIFKPWNIDENDAALAHFKKTQLLLRLWVKLLKPVNLKVFINTIIKG